VANNQNRNAIANGAKGVLTQTRKPESFFGWLDWPG